MATPLRVRGKVIGVIYVDNRPITGLFKSDDLAALDTFAGQAAIAIDNAQLFSATDQKLDERVEELRQLRRIDQQLNETLDVDKAMADDARMGGAPAGRRSGLFGVARTARGCSTANSYGIELDDTLPIFLEKTFPAAMDVVRRARRC